jgi:hypothetical protein
MGLLDILKAIPLAAGEKARADEFGPDYRQRWQKYQDEHVRSELQNAISNTEQQDKARKAAAEMYAAGVGKAPGTPPEKAMGENLAEDRSLGNRLKQANISYLEQRPDLAREGMASREEVASQSLALRRELAATQDETRRALLGIQIERLKGIQDRFDETRNDIGPTITVVDPNNPNGPGIQIDRRTRQPVQFAGGGDPTKPFTAVERKDKSALEVVKEQLQDVKAIALKPNVSERIGFYSGMAEKARNSGLLSPLQNAGLVDQPDPDYVSMVTRLEDIAEGLLRARSGQQINEKEYARLRGLVADAASGGPIVFNVKMQRFEEDLDRLMARRFGGSAAAAPTVPMTTPAKRKAAPPGAVGYNKATNQYILSDGTIVPGEP